MDKLTLFNKTIASKQFPDLRPGDTIRVHQKIKEGAKERIQELEKRKQVLSLHW